MTLLDVTIGEIKNLRTAESHVRTKSLPIDTVTRRWIWCNWTHQGWFFICIFV